MTHCLLCGTPEPFRPLFAFAGYSMVRCPTCGLVFQHPQPSEAILAGAYYHDLSFASALLGPLRQWTLHRARQKLAFVRDSIGDLRAGARTLDVGCSSGAWLEIAATQGWEATGIELGARVAADARKRGLDVMTGTLGEVIERFEPESFDLVTFWDVLEHLRDPRHELELARGLLRHGAHVAVSFPNVGGWYPRVTYRLFARPTGVWEYPELPVHLYDFSSATARRLIESKGFSVTDLRTSSLPFSVYRTTTLSAEQLGGGRRGRALRLAFDVVHRIVYPVADRFDRGNELLVIGTR